MSDKSVPACHQQQGVEAGMSVCISHCLTYFTFVLQQAHEGHSNAPDSQSNSYKLSETTAYNYKTNKGLYPLKPACRAAAAATQEASAGKTGV